mmetsp:Transcript_4864/g.12508  ORF Transcript_4864/g.12508 Transcript_4864/m.12508 type:complete len:216 (+) Transcript_4864:138-785(+)
MSIVMITFRVDGSTPLMVFGAACGSAHSIPPQSGTGLDSEKMDLYGSGPNGPPEIATLPSDSDSVRHLSSPGSQQSPGMSRWYMAACAVPVPSSGTRMWMYPELSDWSYTVAVELFTPACSVITSTDPVGSLAVDDGNAAHTSRLLGINPNALSVPPYPTVTNVPRRVSSSWMPGVSKSIERTENTALLSPGPAGSDRITTTLPSLPSGSQYTAW